MKKVILSTMLMGGLLTACGGSGGSGSDVPANGGDGQGSDQENKAPIASDIAILYGTDKVAIADVTDTKWAGELLTGSFSYSDAENDPQDSAQTSYRWLVDGEEVSTALAYQSQRTDAGKEIVFEITPVAQTGTLKGKAQSSASTQLVAREQVFFVARKPALVSRAMLQEAAMHLYMTDGESENVIELTDALRYIPTTITPIQPTGEGRAPEKWVFTLNNQLWVTDGTKAGTQALITDNAGTEVPVVESAAYLTSFNGHVYFQGDNDLDKQEREIWRTDGTSAGTNLVANLHPQGTSNPYNFKVMGDYLYFVADFNLDGVNHGSELYRMAKDHSYELVKDINPGTAHSQPNALTVIGDKMYFTATPTSGAYAVYVTDGTNEGTEELVRQPTGNGYAPYQFLQPTSSPDIYFTVNNNGGEGTLYRTQGTRVSTSAHNINSTNFNLQAGPQVQLLGTLGDRLIFASKRKGSSDKLMIAFKRSSGIGYDTSHIMGFAKNPTSVVTLGNKLIFSAENASISGRNLFVADSSTFARQDSPTLLDINSGNPSSPRDLTVVNGKVLLVATQATSGQEVWSTDGTQSGTELFKDVYPGEMGSSPEFELSQLRK